MIPVPLRLIHVSMLMEYSAVFQAGGLVVVLVEVGRKAYLASMVPVIVNAILGEHQLIVDIVAFVSKGDFPRSRLGEKQRGKILASWVTRKLHTIAQFSIRDADAADSQITEVAEPRSGLGSTVGVGSSLRNVKSVHSPPAEDMQAQDYMALPPGISEMPVTSYENSIVESPPLALAEEDRDDTPTDARAFQNDYPTPTGLDPGEQYRSNYMQFGGPVSAQELPETSHELRLTNASAPGAYPDYHTYSSLTEATPNANKSEFDFSNPETFDASPPEIPYASKPTLSLSHQREPSTERFGDLNGNGDLWSLPSSQRRPSYNTSGSNPPQTGAQVFSPDTHSDHRNNELSSRGQSSQSSSDDHEDWPQEALMHMSLSNNRGGRDARRQDGNGRNPRRDVQYDGSGYGHAI